MKLAHNDINSDRLCSQPRRDAKQKPQLSWWILKPQVKRSLSNFILDFMTRLLKCHRHALRSHTYLSNRFNLPLRCSARRRSRKCHRGFDWKLIRPAESCPPPVTHHFVQNNCELFYPRDEEKNCSYLEREERKTVELSKLHEIEMFSVMILMNEYEEAFRPITSSSIIAHNYKISKFLPSCEVSRKKRQTIMFYWSWPFHDHRGAMKPQIDPKMKKLFFDADRRTNFLKIRN